MAKRPRNRSDWDTQQFVPDMGLPGGRDPLRTLEEALAYYESVAQAALEDSNAPPLIGAFQVGPAPQYDVSVPTTNDSDTAKFLSRPLNPGIVGALIGAHVKAVRAAMEQNVPEAAALLALRLQCLGDRLEYAIRIEGTARIGARSRQQSAKRARERHTKAAASIKRRDEALRKRARELRQAGRTPSMMLNDRTVKRLSSGLKSSTLLRKLRQK